MEARDLIRSINLDKAKVVAVDLPSGINGSTGALMGVSINADETVTFSGESPGIFCFRAARNAAASPSPISEFRRPSSR